MDYHTVSITTSPQETKKLGENLAKTIIQAREDEYIPKILCLRGDLGSGKTTYIQGFAKGLGVLTRLLSPTFIIVRRYDLIELQCVFYHMDLYRLVANVDYMSLGLQEIFQDPKAFIAIEWADKLSENLPLERIDISFKVVDGDKHEIITNVV